MSAMSYSRAELERAMARNEIVPYFQPLVEMQTGRIMGFEALARWQHPRDGLILPKDFILLTEAYGLSRELTFSIMRQVVEAARSLPSDLDYNVNASPLQLRDSSLPRAVEEAVHTGDPSGTFPLNRLTIEITEIAFVHNLGQAANIASEIKELGLRLALDDFGTGYSSLLHLQSLPFDAIKIDQSFVRHMVQQRGSRKIVSAVLGLGHSLGLMTVAEGVEDEEQQRMLESLGCAVGQGWRFGYPMPVEALPEFLANAEKASGLKTSPQAVSSPEAFYAHTGQLSLQHLAHLRAIFAGMPIGLCLLDRRMHITSFNQRLAQMLPNSSGSLLGQSLEEILPHAAYLLRPYLRSAFKGEPVQGIEVPLHQTGSSRQASSGLVSLQPVRDEANEVIGVAASFTDITRRKHLHDALRHSNTFLKTIWNTAPFGIITATRAGGLCNLSGNPEAERILRHRIASPAQNRDAKAWRIFDEQAKPIAWEDTPLMRAIREARSIAAERVLYLRGDDTLTTLQVAAAPLLTASGNILGAVMTVADLESESEKTSDASLAADLAATFWSSGSEC